MHLFELDLVLSLGILICGLNIMPHSFSDHCPVVFNVNLPSVCPYINPTYSIRISQNAFIA